MIRLVKVNKDNWEECINLPTSEDHVRFVAPNVYSIAKAQLHPDTLKAYCIYADEIMVGFIMYGPREDDPSLLWIDEMMISEGQRRRGYGRTALQAIFDDAKQQGYSRVGLSTKPENVKAIHLYKSVGFRSTGETYDGGEEFIIDLFRSITMKEGNTHGQ